MNTKLSNCISLLFNTIDIKQKEKFWCILYAIYLRFNNKDVEKDADKLNKICLNYFNFRCIL